MPRKPETENRALVLIGGGPGSGKSHIARWLRDVLVRKIMHIDIFSTNDLAAFEQARVGAANAAWTKEQQ